MKKRKFFRLLLAVFAAVLAFGSSAVAQDGRYLVVRTQDMEYYPWDTQFYIYSPTKFVEGDEWEVSMMVRADKVTEGIQSDGYGNAIDLDEHGGISTQTHSDAPGSYRHWAAIGNVKFTTEWEQYTYSGTFVADQIDGDYITFNLNDFNPANNYYFDNISFKINGVEQIVNGDLEYDDFSAFWVKEYPASAPVQVTLDNIEGVSNRPALKDGYYQISNADELYWFIDFVNKKVEDGWRTTYPNNNANAVLTADIVVNENVLTTESTPNEAILSSIEESKHFYTYKGIFDGQGHTIKGLYYPQGTPLFTDLNGTVKNLGLEDFLICFKNGNTFGTGGVISGYGNRNEQTVISNCYLIGYIDAMEANDCGGFCSDNYGTITDCFSLCTIRKANETIKFGSICWRNYGTIKNSYGSSDFSRCNVVGINYEQNYNATLENVADYTTAELANGKFVANGWKQGSVNGNTYTFPVQNVFSKAYSVTLRNPDKKVIATPYQYEYHLMEPFNIAGAGVGVAQDGRIYVLEKLTEQNFSNFSTVQPGKLIDNYTSADLSATIKAGELTAEYKYMVRPYLCSIWFNESQQAGYPNLLRIPLNADLNSDKYTFSFCWECYTDEYDFSLSAPLGVAKITGLDVTYPGTYHVRLDYGNRYAIGDIIVYKPVKNLDLSKVNATIYPYGKLSGSIKVNYEDGTTEDVDITAATFEFNNSKVGKTTVEIALYGATSKLDVNIVADPTEPKKDANGFYQIATKEDLYWLANYINNGGSNADAVLTNDIVVNENVLTPDGKFNEAKASTFTEWTPIIEIGGIFDGQGHTISGLYYADNPNSSTNNGPGFCNYIRGTVKNLGLENVYFKGTNAHGLCGWTPAGAQITNCYTTGLVEGDQSGAFISYTPVNATITNCFTLCTNSTCAFGASWGEGTLTNCFVNSDFCKTNELYRCGAYTTEELCNGTFVPRNGWDGWTRGSFDGKTYTLPMPDVFKEPVTVSITDDEPFIDIKKKSYHIGDPLELGEKGKGYVMVHKATNGKTLPFVTEMSAIEEHGSYDGQCIVAHADDIVNNIWDSQFFIVFEDNPALGGETWEYTMKIRADKDARISTQIHQSPQEYIYYVGIDTVDFSTEWKTITRRGTFVSKDQWYSYNTIRSIAFNLNDCKEANNYYFAYISLKINGKEVIASPELKGNNNFYATEFGINDYPSLCNIQQGVEYTVIRDPFKLTQDNVTGFTTEKPGNYTAKVTCNGKTYDYNYSVYGVDRIENLKTQFRIGAYLDDYDYTYSIYYTNNTRTTGYMSDLNISGNFDINTPGDYKVKVSYYDYSVDTTFTVYNEVESLDVTNVEKEMYYGAEYKGTFVARYVDGTSEVIDAAQLGKCNYSIGKRTITVQYRGASAEMDMNILQDDIAKYELKFPQTAYNYGDALNITDAVVTVTRQSGKVEDLYQLTNYSDCIFGYNSTKTQKQTVYFMYGNYPNMVEIPFDVTVNAPNPYPQPAIKDGFYQISNAEELLWFVYDVNNGDRNANAVLTQDIVINEDCLKRLTALSKAGDELSVWQPIGTLLNAFNGIFDGQGHTISGLYINDKTQQNVGLFGVTSADAVIKNLGVTDSYIAGKENVGAICGNNEGVIVNCYTTATVEGEKSVSGIAGKADGKIANSYYLAERAKADDPSAKTAADFKNGEVARLLSQGAVIDGETISGEDFNNVTVLPGVEDLKTPVSEIAPASAIDIWAFEKTIYVQNPGKDIRIADMSGRLVMTIKATADRMEIPMQKAGIYIVKTGVKTQKVIIR